MAVLPAERQYRDRLYDDEKLEEARAHARGAAEADSARFADVERFCLFIGYSQSGHTLVGSLLNAHRHVVIAHELDALHLVDAGFSREELFASLLERDAEFAELGRRWTGYDYNVPDQWQGRTFAPRVIGDKKGRRSTLRLNEQPELLARLRETVQVPLRVIHVVRDPYDVIASMAGHSGGGSLDRWIDHYFELAATNDRIRATLGPDELLDLRLEDLIANPCEELARMCAFLGLDTEPSYYDACANVVFARPRRPSERAPWSEEQRSEVAERLAAHQFLTGYER